MSFASQDFNTPTDAPSAPSLAPPPDAHQVPNLTTCDQEPIHIPGSIQPHGVLLVLADTDGGWTVSQVSANVDGYLGSAAEDVLGRSVTELFAERDAPTLEAGLADASLEKAPLHLGTVSNRDRDRYFQALAHRVDGVLILELEPANARVDASFQGLYPLVRTFLARLENVDTTQELNRLAAEEVRRITGFDRVLIYQFDSEWNGLVVAEDRNERLPSYLGLHFPASDIPRQARELYRLNRVRLIRDADYRPVPLIPTQSPNGKPLDLSFATLRSVSPVHVEYMQNMETKASMSISVMRDGQLWGLISCHNQEARNVPYEVRTACDLLGQVLSLQLAAKEHAAEFDHRLRLRVSQEKLVAAMTEAETYAVGLLKRPEDLLRFQRASGAAVVDGRECRLIGTAPPADQVHALVAWLETRDRDLFFTSHLIREWPEAEGMVPLASGVLAISLSRLHRRWLLWFRPEVLQTVTWGGDPRKPTGPSTGGEPGTPERLHPRKSFEAWQEVVRCTSLPWLHGEVDAAWELRAAIVNIVLRRAEELAQLNEELERSNRELEAFSYSVSHDLRAPFRHITGFSQLLMTQEGDRLSEKGQRYLRTIVDSARHAGALVDSLLKFSQMGRSALRMQSVDMNDLVAEARASLAVELDGRDVRWIQSSLPRVAGDRLMLGQVWQNLLSNALKYTKQEPQAEITITCRRGESPADPEALGDPGKPRREEWIFEVRDNGVGFDPAYGHKLFGVFQRLHPVEEFEGIGIGLANVRRIVERHRGRVWAEGRLGEGASFFFSLPAEAAVAT